jgi:hypothetical protein
MSYSRINKAHRRPQNNLQGLKVTHRIDPEAQKFIRQTSYIIGGVLLITAVLKYLK